MHCIEVPGKGPDPASFARDGTGKHRTNTLIIYPSTILVWYITTAEILTGSQMGPGATQQTQQKDGNIVMSNFVVMVGECMIASVTMFGNFAAWRPGVANAPRGKPKQRTVYFASCLYEGQIGV